MIKLLFRYHDNKNFYSKVESFFPNYRKTIVLFANIIYFLSFSIFFSIITGVIFEDNDGDLFNYNLSHLYSISVLIFILLMIPPLIDERFINNYFLYKKNLFNRIFFCFYMIFLSLIRISILPLFFISLLFSYIFFQSNFYSNFLLYISINILSVIIVSIIYSSLLFFKKNEKLLGLIINIIPLFLIFLFKDLNTINYLFFLIGLIITYLTLFSFTLILKFENIY